MPNISEIFHTRPVALVGVVGIVFLVLSWIIALGPALQLREQTKLIVATLGPPSDAVLRGRDVYLAEGCGYCHSQLVRATFVDAPYGRAHKADDYAGQNPPMPGSQRTGPDLSDVGNRQPSWIWNFMHLYNPRSMVAQSIMPSFPWYFDVMTPEKAAEHPYALYAATFDEAFLEEGLVALPTQQAVDLVTYLRSLKQD